MCVDNYTSYKVKLQYNKHSMDIQEEVKNVEQQLVDLIVRHLEADKIEVERAQKLAADFLGVLPVSDQKDLLAKLQELSQNYEEAKEVYVSELSRINEQNRQIALTQMRDHIKIGNIEQAITVAKAMTNNQN